MFELLLSTCIRIACGAVAMGWLLSSIGQLNARGYALGGLPILLLIAFASRSAINDTLRLSAPRRLIQWWKRRRILPLIYAATVVVIVLGSLLYEPNNYDGLCYREPKVLFWLDASRWHWIDSPFGVVNYTMPNYEWLTLPLFLITRSFHAAVLINWICFLSLPPLFFSLLRVFGAPRRFAYDWMWLFPSGYLIAMQAGGIGNDLLGMAAILAGLHFARRFNATGKHTFLFDALLAGGLCTGVKICNLPLAGFVLILLLINLPLIRRRITTFAIAVLSATTVSALIPLALNFIHAGSILGTTTGADQTTNFAAGLVGNALMLLASCIAPPLFPGSHQITATIEHGLGSVAEWIHSAYPKFTLQLNELPQEESSGLGLGITIALAISAFWYFRYRSEKRRHAIGEISRWQRLAWNVWLMFGLAVLLGRLGTGQFIARELLPWTPLLLAPILAAIGCGQTPRTKVWRVAAPLISLSVLPALLITPSRPLIPPATLLRLGQKLHFPSSALERVSVTYDVYAKRPDPFVQIKNALPRNVRVLALVTGADEPTTGWLKPFGSRRLMYLTSTASIVAARKNGVRFVVVQESSCRNFFNMDSETWMKWQQARPVVSSDIRILASQPPWHYTLATFDPKPTYDTESK